MSKKFKPVVGDVLYTTDKAPMGSKPIGVVTDINWHMGLFTINRRRGDEQPHVFHLAEVKAKKSGTASWEVEWLWGRTNAPRYWLKGNFLKKIAGVFERQGVYENQAEIHWERDEGGLWAVMRVAIKEDENARTI